MNLVQYDCENLKFRVTEFHSVTLYLYFHKGSFGKVWKLTEFVAL